MSLAQRVEEKKNFPLLDFFYRKNLVTVKCKSAYFPIKENYYAHACEKKMSLRDRTRRLKVRAPQE